MTPLTSCEKAVKLEKPVSLHDQVEQLFHEARDNVYYYILSFGLAAHEAQEITQDVFLRLYVALQRGDDIGNLRGWVFRVAHNLALNAVEKSATQRLFSLELSGLEVAHGEGPEQELIRRQAAAKMRESLAALSPQERLCLQLRAEGLRYAEIARVVGVATSTAGEFLSRAIKKLKKAVHE